MKSEKAGREVLYQRTDDALDLTSWADALAYFSEEDPVGVVGSFLIDKLDQPSDAFRFKHHYILHTLDSDVLCELLQAIDERRAVELVIRSLRSAREYQRTVCPLKIYISTQSGRQYLWATTIVAGVWSSSALTPSRRFQSAMWKSITISISGIRRNLTSTSGAFLPVPITIWITLR